MIDSAIAMPLLRQLAHETTTGLINLPALPATVVRLRRETDRKDFDVGKAAQIACSEPALAGSILAMANSFLHRKTGNETLDLKLAIPRIGVFKLRALTMRFALQRMSALAENDLTRDILRAEWAIGRTVGAAAFLLADRFDATSQDDALVVGLLHNVGRIYLFSRLAKHPELFADRQRLYEFVESWHAGVAKGIIESWRLPEPALMAFAVQAGDTMRPGQSLAHVLQVAIAIAGHDAADDPEKLAQVAAYPACSRLGITETHLSAIQLQVEETRVALGLLN